jgi:hypothetical protein
MMDRMPGEDVSSDQIRLRAAEHLEKLMAQLRRDAEELSRSPEGMEELGVEAGRVALAEALEAARQLAAKIGKS